MGSIFIRYGLKSGGGAPFLRRTRNAFGQLQTRTRTGSTSNQLQTRARTCNCSFSTQRLWVPSSFWVCGWPFSRNAGQYCNQACSYGWDECRDNGYSSGCGNFNAAPATYYATCQDVTTGGCSWGGFSGWYGTGSCSPSSSGCWSQGQINRECQTASVCSFSAFTGWSNTSSCSAANPACSNGAVNRQCQTVFSFREEDWSVFEEAETCTTSSPTAASGAVQVECIAN